MIEREPLTVVVSQKGWIRALKGQVGDLSAASFKGDDGLQTSFFAETTSKILVLASDGKVFTLDASKLPGGRGQGEPIRLMADIDESAAIVAVWPHAPGARAADRRLRRQRLPRRRGRSPVLDAQGSGGAQRERQGDGGADRPGRPATMSR